MNQREWVLHETKTGAGVLALNVFKACRQDTPLWFRRLDLEATTSAALFAGFLVTIGP